MRQLSDEQTKQLFLKLEKFIGSNVKYLIDRPDGPFLFREHKKRIYYVQEKMLKMAETVSPSNFVCTGTCLGRIFKSGKIYLTITALNCLAPYATHKMWLKPTGEQQFLYGHNVTKSGLERLSEDIQKYQGVILLSINDIPLGFGIAARSTAECNAVDPLATVCFHQADIGEYIRTEDSLI